MADTTMREMMEREREREKIKRYQIQLVYDNISNLTVHMTFPWWETYLTLPP
jgi:hypothetical protein